MPFEAASDLSVIDTESSASDLSVIDTMSISDSNRDCKITISLSVPCSEESISQSFSLPFVSYILSGSSSTVIPWLYIGGINVFF